MSSSLEDGLLGTEGQGCGARTQRPDERLHVGEVGKFAAAALNELMEPAATISKVTDVSDHH